MCPLIGGWLSYMIGMILEITFYTNQGLASGPHPPKEASPIADRKPASLLFSPSGPPLPVDGRVHHDEQRVQPAVFLAAGGFTRPNPRRSLIKALATRPSSPYGGGCVPPTQFVGAPGVKLFA